ncbi:hypothetical protein AAEJ42_18210 [Shewanella algae]|uniref:hypothetical protein n=1 Tax=Shewanella algae TaxID=38313 RepID=UPI00313D2A54
MDSKLSMIKDTLAVAILLGSIIFTSWLVLHDGNNINNQKIDQIQIDVGEIKRELPTLRMQVDRNSGDIQLLKHQVQNLNKQNEEAKKWRENMIRIEEQNKQIAESLERTNKKLDILTERISKWEK